MRGGTGDWRRSLPASRAARALLAIGAAVLLAVIPTLWMWVVHGSAAGPTGVYAAAVGLSALALGTGLTMIRLLDGGK